MHYPSGHSNTPYSRSSFLGVYRFRIPGRVIALLINPRTCIGMAPCTQAGGISGMCSGFDAHLLCFTWTLELLGQIQKSQL